VDVQDDRLEGEIRAFGVGEESWGIRRFIIYGSPALNNVWDELDEIILSEYESELGVKLKVSCTCIDSGGHFTDDVYRYCKDREIYRVFAVKGANTPAKPIISKPSKNNKLKINLFTVGTDTAKELIYARLKLQDPDKGYYHWNASYDEEYFEQLTSEKAVTRYSKGVAYREWVKMRARNEALDFNVYALAAVRILNPNYEAILNLLSKKKEPKKKKEKPKNNRWASSWKKF